MLKLPCMVLTVTVGRFLCDSDKGTHQGDMSAESQKCPGFCSFGVATDGERGKASRSKGRSDRKTV